MGISYNILATEAKWIIKATELSNINTIRTSRIMNTNRTGVAVNMWKWTIPIISWLLFESCVISFSFRRLTIWRAPSVNVSITLKDWTEVALKRWRCAAVSGTTMSPTSEVGLATFFHCCSASTTVSSSFLLRASFFLLPVCERSPCLALGDPAGFFFFSPFC